MPRVGSSRIRTLGSDISPFRDNDLLLISTAQGTGSHIDRRTFGIQRLAELLYLFLFLTAVDEQSRELLLQVRQGNILPDGAAEHQSPYLSVLAYHGDLIGNGVPGLLM